MSSDISPRRRVVLAEDDGLLRYTLKLIIEKHHDVVGEAQDGEAAVELVDQLRPDVVLLDISMPLMGGFAATRLIRERLPEVRVIIVSNYTAPGHVEEAFRNGAHGYVVKGAAVLQLPKAMQEVLDGRLFRPT